MKLVQNERSWAISLISHINTFLNGKTLKIKKADGERTVNTGKKRMFPDVLIYGDVDKHLLMQGWEVKMPDVSITDVEFYEDAKRKAVNLGLNSFFMWNFSYGKLFIKDGNDFVEDKIWDLSSDIKTREDVETHKSKWEKSIEDILLYINSKFTSRTLKSASLGEIVSNKIMNSIIDRNKSLTAESLKIKASSNATVRANLDLWWSEVKAEYLKEEKDAFNAYSRMLILGWLNRFIFANVIKKYHTPATKVEDITFGISVDEGIEIFKYITSKCDFYNVFSITDFSEFIATETWDDLVEFNSFIKDNNIDKVEHESFQNILEGSVNTSKREVLGQYTTPVKLAELLVNVSINDIMGDTIDPCSGTGTIAVQALKLKKGASNSENALSTTWCSDKQSFPLQIASVNFTDSEAINVPSLIFQENVFSLNEGNRITVTNPVDGSDMYFEIPKFTNIVSNLPFVSSNKGKMEKEAIMNVIAEVKKKTGIQLSERNDLYTYIAFKLWHNLIDNGRLGVITSNSWFATDAGKQFYQAIKYYYNILGFVISGNDKWFKNADVRTTILVLEKKEIGRPNAKHEVNVSTLIKRLEEYDEHELQTVINTIIVGTNHNQALVVNDSFTYEEIDNILDMNVSLNSLFHEPTWLLDIEDKLDDLSEYYTVYRGEKTGQDPIFLLQDGKVVDEEFLIKGLKNAKKVDRLLAKADTDILACNLTMNELKEQGKTKTYNWFKKFESNINKSLKVKKDRWNILNTSKVSNLFTSMNPDARIFFGRFETPTFINQRLIGLMKKSSTVDDELNHALLNSMIGMFYIEAIGFGRGLGALDFSKDNLAKIKMLNPSLLSEDDRERILEAFKPILDREIMKLSEELHQADRVVFEKIVLEIYGIGEMYEPIKTSILSMHKNRLSVKSS